MVYIDLVSEMERIEREDIYSPPDSQRQFYEVHIKTMIKLADAAVEKEDPAAATTLLEEMAKTMKSLYRTEEHRSFVREHALDVLGLEGEINLLEFETARKQKVTSLKGSSRGNC